MRGARLAIKIKVMMMMIPARDSLCLKIALTMARKPTWDWRRGSSCSVDSVNASVAVLDESVIFLYL